MRRELIQSEECFQTSQLHSYKQKFLILWHHLISCASHYSKSYRFFLFFSNYFFSEEMLFQFTKQANEPLRHLTAFLVQFMFPFSCVILMLTYCSMAIICCIRFYVASSELDVSKKSLLFVYAQ